LRRSNRDKATNARTPNTTPPIAGCTTCLPRRFPAEDSHHAMPPQHSMTRFSRDTMSPNRHPHPDPPTLTVPSTFSQRPRPRIYRPPPARGEPKASSPTSSVNPFSHRFRHMNTRGRHFNICDGPATTSDDVGAAGLSPLGLADGAANVPTRSAMVNYRRVILDQPRLERVKDRYRIACLASVKDSTGRELQTMASASRATFLNTTPTHQESGDKQSGSNRCEIVPKTVWDQVGLGDWRLGATRRRNQAKFSSGTFSATWLQHGAVRKTRRDVFWGSPLHPVTAARAARQRTLQFTRVSTLVRSVRITGFSGEEQGGVVLRWEAGGGDDLFERFTVQGHRRNVVLSSIFFTHLCRIAGDADGFATRLEAAQTLKPAARAGAFSDVFICFARVMDELSDKRALGRSDRRSTWRFNSSYAHHFPRYKAVSSAADSGRSDVWR
ncbi:hypothetical protein BaRGS_00036071, partial [Batillaria attramentaria]